MTYRAAINKALKQLMEENDRVVLIGQSIRDPYGGACKVTRGLTKHFDSRIFDAPISEAAEIGWANGLALGGYIPIVEIMFSDFLTLCVNQIHNVARLLNQHSPGHKIIIRTLAGAGKAYGPTHSQDMRWLINAMPCVEICSPTIHTDIYGMYQRAISSDVPVWVIVEGKPYYAMEMEWGTIGQ